MVPRIAKLWMTQDYVKRLLDYDPDSGLFSWRGNHAGKPAGSLAGSIRRDFAFVTLHGARLPYPDLAWLWMTGSFPDDNSTVVHIDGNTLRNAWRNLRLVRNSKSGRI